MSPPEPEPATWKIEILILDQAPEGKWNKWAAATGNFVYCCGRSAEFEEDQDCWLLPNSGDQMVDDEIP